MALTSDEQRRCYFYLGYIQVNRAGVFVGGVPETLEIVQKLQVALNSVTANGETTVRDLLTTLDGLYAKLKTVDSRFQATAIGTIKLNAKEWDQRMVQWDFFRHQLGTTLDVEVDPETETSDGGGDSSMDGPWREP